MGVVANDFVKLQSNIKNAATLQLEETVISEISVEVISEGVAIRHAGTGCNDGDYPPIIVEWWDGVPRIVIWGDINDQDPTHIIDMSKALESNRRVDND
jgi:hypothetical protein